MEKKKLLSVAVIVGAVLALVIALPLLIIAPRQRAAALARNNRNRPPAVIDNGFNIPVQPETPAPAITLQPPPQTTPVVPVMPVNPPELTPPAAPQTTTITIPTPRAPAVPDVRVKPVVKPPAPVRPKPAPVVTKAAPKPVPKAAPKPAPAPKYDNYWVQTGAFSTKVRAEGARESLASKGITSIIDNRDISGKTMYRVRVGPYTTESEANYWLTLVKEIDGFGESQIRLSQSSPR